jgi:HSP20 family molecular chaperone IbpA
MATEYGTYEAHQAELPSMKPENVSVDFTDGMLTIRGEKVDEKTEKEDDRTY